MTGMHAIYRCRSCGAAVDPTTPVGAVVLTKLGPETRN